MYRPNIIGAFLKQMSFTQGIIKQIGIKIRSLKKIKKKIYLIKINYFIIKILFFKSIKVWILGNATTCLILRKV